MRRRPSVYDLLKSKGRKKYVQLHVDSAEEAAAAEAAGIEILSCESDETLPAIRAAAPAAFISAGLKNRAIASAEQAIRLGFAGLEMGADALYCSSSPGIIEAMAREGIPVTGHVGLVPNHATWTNFRAVGKSPEEALKVFRAMKTLESAGCCCIEVEVVPVRLAAFLTESTPLITMGMGCGSACDTQYLFSSDVLGTFEGPTPRHAKNYADIPAMLAKVQEARVAAFRAFADDVTTGRYPEPRHQVDVSDEVFSRFHDLAEKA